MIRGKGRKILSFMRIRTLDLKISRLNALLLSHGKVNNELSHYLVQPCFLHTALSAMSKLSRVEIDRNVKFSKQSPELGKCSKCSTACLQVVSLTYSWERMKFQGLLGLTAFSLTQDQTPKKRGFLQLC